MQPPVPRGALLAVCALLVGIALVGAAQSLALAADGSYYLVRVLETEAVVGPESRTFANVVRQAPVLLAARTGVDDTSTLSVLQGIGQLLLPALAWCTAIVLARKETIAFVAVSTAAVLSLGGALFFNVSESLLAVALTALLATALWLPDSWSREQTALACAAALVLVASYESTAVTGGFLAAWAGWRALRSQERVERYGAAVVCVLSAVSIPVALYGTGTGSGPVSARSSSHSIASFEPSEFYAAFVAAVLVVGALVLPGRREFRLVAVAVTAALACVALYRLPATPLASFQARGGMALAGLALTLFLASLWLRRGHGQGRAGRPSDETLVAWVPVLLAGAMVVSSVQGLARWSDSLEAFRTGVDAAMGVVPVDDAVPPDRRWAVWSWTSPSLSLIVRRDAESGILADPSPSFVPFTPETARQHLPDRYTW